MQIDENRVRDWLYHRDAASAHQRAALAVAFGRNTVTSRRYSPDYPCTFQGHFPAHLKKDVIALMSRHNIRWVHEPIATENTISFKFGGTSEDMSRFNVGFDALVNPPEPPKKPWWKIWE